jgi:hypothetical protein
MINTFYTFRDRVAENAIRISSRIKYFNRLSSSELVGSTRGQLYQKLHELIKPGTETNKVAVQAADV